ncbi:MAG: hypothetical protein H5T86_09755 [Armatimonadetes bacterium]|nr:hypothetical protein [Armatimonadota bacterium]
MPIRARVLTKVELPEEIEVEIEDTLRGEKVVRTVKFSECVKRLKDMGSVDLEAIEPAELVSIACALAKHIAIDDYLRSIGVDPHKT